MSEDTNTKSASIEAVAELTRAAQMKALEANLTFEAYLLHGVLVALEHHCEIDASQA